MADFNRDKMTFHALFQTTSSIWLMRLNELVMWPLPELKFMWGLNIRSGTIW